MLSLANNMNSKQKTNAFYLHKLNKYTFIYLIC